MGAVTFEELVYQFLDRRQNFLISNRCFSKVGYSMELNASRDQRRNVLGSHLAVYLRMGGGEVIWVEVNENIKLGYSQDQGYLLVSGLGFGLV